jgi:hypothetical protein
MKTALLVLWVLISQFCFGQSIERQIIASLAANTSYFQAGVNFTGYRIYNLIDPSMVVSLGFQQQTALDVN